MLVGVVVVVPLGVGSIVGYNYCTQESGEETLGDCLNDTAVNVYRTAWGSSDGYRSSGINEGKEEYKTFYSKALDQSIQYEIYLPPGYKDSNNASVRYPVVYLLPGSSGGATVWKNGGEVAKQMDTLLAQGKVRPMILVSPQESPKSFAIKGTGYVDGPLGNWATYTSEDLVDEIDSNYRTVPYKDGRAIAGNSEGAYGAMNLGLKNPSKYGVIGSFSGYFTIDKQDLSRIFEGDQSLADENSPQLYLPQLEGELPAIYLLIGNEDKHNVEENYEFAEALKAKGTTVDFESFPGSHNWDLWEAHVPDFLVYTSEHLRGGE